MKNSKKKKITPGFRLFLATSPLLILTFLFSYLPIAGWRFVLFDYKPGRALLDCEFVGLENFTKLFRNPVSRRELIRVLKNTLGMSTLGMFGSFIPMLFAILHNELRGKRYRKLVQTITTIPNFISWVLVFSLVTALFSMDTGVVNIVLKGLGITDKGLNILGSGKHVWLTMWLYGLWKGTGWSAIIYISGISSIDQQLYEAAAVDGAGRFRRIWHITVPGMMPTFITLLVMSIGNFLNTGMDQYYVFQNAFNKEHIEVLDLYVYNVGLQGNNISGGIAIGMMKSLIAIFLLMVANFISGKVRDEKVF